MKIILLQDIRNIGCKNEIKEVKDGYARNVLLPQKLVRIATAEAVQKLQAEIKKSQTEKEKFLSRLRLQAESLKNISLEFRVRANEKGEIFGSVSVQDIKKSLLEKGFETAVAIIEKPLKKTGEYQVEIDLGNDIKSFLKILIISIR